MRLASGWHDLHMYKQRFMESFVKESCGSSRWHSLQVYNESLVKCSFGKFC